MAGVPLAKGGSTPIETIRASVGVFVTLTGAACGITMLYLGMRAVMDIGGACASGGPFVPRVECPEGVPVLMLGGIWGGIIFTGLYARQTSKRNVPSFLGFAWSALFLSLGWNFLEYGFDAPGESGLVWGWLICGVFFVLMGGIPLYFAFGPVLGQFLRRETPPPPFVVPTKSRIRAEIERRREPTSSPRRPDPFARAEATSAEDADELVNALQRLETMYKAGSLTRSEFEAGKKRILGVG